MNASTVPQEYNEKPGEMILHDLSASARYITRCDNEVTAPHLKGHAMTMAFNFMETD